jgi:hypothetical protein
MALLVTSLARICAQKSECMYSCVNVCKEMGRM